ncbi:hypothetical protein H7J88_18465 [Mycolicibacterium flavescens]|uniref:Transmembrane protein n=1 Tax=Mycolicibacterium flavescens TaxID=1776 RepID=A0A1E3RP65_MYCFV|nr:hypothetical protein [Mycolicibacterium flavescens]MCV7281620.1 hypothetical protein [Mycolicibacterium flavescens]ODQ91649.1 hypothetical protein BHQ18_06180 [Mycolicibacterium flavescens]
MSTAPAIAVAVVFVWLGMVLAISFIEAPLKFRAPGVTLKVGLGIGRLVFRALNTVEAVLAAVLVIAIVLDPPRVVTIVAVAVAIVMLVGQLAIRPALNRRSDTVLAAPDSQDPGGRSRAHFGYVALELVKVPALIVAGVTLLA